MKILISSCLLGEKVRYDGSHNKIDATAFESIVSHHQLISFCPEVEGGLSTPRNPAEILKDKVLTKENQDVTQAFIKGANKALTLCKEQNITVALLKANSPSCSNQYIYDGSFSKKLIQGMGLTAKILSKNGIKVFNETELEELVLYLTKR